jgi:sec-independent protein translocase protein TatC
MNKEELEMSLFGHLSELRTRLVKAIIAIILGAIVSYLISGEIFDFLCKPFFSAFHEGALIGTGPADAFILKLKVAAITGIILVSPYIFLQIWLFIAPGLRTHERKMIVPFIFCTSLLFLMGIWFSYKAVLPFAFDFFFEQYGSIKITPTIRITEHISFMATTLLSFGLVFEMPVLAYFLGRLGIITSEWLIKSFRMAIVVIFIISAIMTPPDVFTQFLMAGPLLLLYGLSILVVKFSEKARNAAEPVTENT